MDVSTRISHVEGAWGPGGRDNPYVGFDVRFSAVQLQTRYPAHTVSVDDVPADVRELIGRRWLADYDGAWLVGHGQGAEIAGS